MSDVRVSGIHVYPIKGAAGVSLERVALDGRGPGGDREFMLVDLQDRFVTQREAPKLALIRVETGDGSLRLSAPGAAGLEVPIARDAAGSERSVVCWASECRAVDQGDAVAGWLTERLEREVRLVRMASDFARVVNPARSPERATTSFTDGYPWLLIGEASLADLNARMEAPLPMDRFRPNLVLSGSDAYAEDGWGRIRIAADGGGWIEMDLVKPCSRCAVTTTDQATAARGREPLATLARYRRMDGQVWFGQNAVHRALGSIALGAAVEVLERVEPPTFD